jgi:hypothetical protein
MAMKLMGLTALACGLAPALLPAAAQAQPAHKPAADDQNVEQRIDDLKAMKKEMQHMMRAYEARIEKLEAEVKARPPAPVKVAADNPQPPPGASPEQQLLAISEESDGSVQIAKAKRRKATDDWDFGSWGTYTSGKGFVLTRGVDGDVNMSLIAYARYLNQTGLDPSYTDSFGRTTQLHLRQDLQWNKVNLSFKGWLFDPDFNYRVWIWTQQPAMGEGAQVVVGGHLGYHFNDYFNIYAGIAPLPSTRSTNWTYPFWLKMDNRTIADDFFRASYSQGIWADGKILDDLQYRVMISNNLSALGVSASQLDAQFNTMAGYVWWMPTTGEFGPAAGFGDFEGHKDVATLLGVHYTRSREDKQSQPGVNDIDNSQIRLSDGTLLFSPNAFNTGGQVNKATYQMADLDTGIKYRGFSLEAEYYWRWVNDFDVTGVIPVNKLFDQGYQVQASAMIMPRQLQFYVSGSEILGQYGNPWDATVGLNWFPFLKREVHINVEGIYLSHSPVGGISYPYIVGGNGWLYNTDFIVTF